MAIWVFISSGDLSSTVSQNGVNSRSELFMHASTMDHISLHKTSVETYGYLGSAVTDESLNLIDRKQHDVLESSHVLPLYLTRNIAQQPLQHVDLLEIVTETSVLGFAFLEEVVFF